MKNVYSDLPKILDNYDKPAFIEFCKKYRDVNVSAYLVRIYDLHLTRIQELMYIKLARTCAKQFKEYEKHNYTIPPSCFHKFVFRDLGVKVPLEIIQFYNALYAYDELCLGDPTNYYSPEGIALLEKISNT